jgi:hypothetical protein
MITGTFDPHVAISAHDHENGPHPRAPGLG